MTEDNDINPFVTELIHVRAQQREALDIFRDAAARMNDMMVVSQTLSLLALQMAQHACTDGVSALNKMKSLFVELELTDAQHMLIQPALDRLLHGSPQNQRTPPAGA